MKTSHNQSPSNMKTHLQVRLQIQDFLLGHLARALLILTILSVSCTNPPAPTTPATPGPPATANGQAILGWGGNSSGQIGDGSTSQRLSPSLVTLKNIQAIAAGGDYSLALTSDGRVLEWGGGKTIPTEVAGLTPIKQIAAGDRHRLALKEDGTVMAWGENNHGQIGDGSNSSRSTPVQVVGLNNVLSIAAAGDHSLAIQSDLSVWAWGANGNGQLGDGTKTDRWTPVTVAGVKAIEVAASSSHSLALTTDLKVMGWGSNSECQLGEDPHGQFDPIVCSEHLLPTVVFEKQAAPYPSSKGHAIAATTSITLVVISDGNVYGVGGQGDPNPILFRGMCNTDIVLGPGIVWIFAPVVAVVAGTKYALFLTDTGEVWGLGANLAGQGGLGTTSVQECPHAISSMKVRAVSRLAAGNEHSLALVKGTLSFSPTTLDFGNRLVGTSNASPMNITVTNNGLAPVTFYDIKISSSGDYSLSENCPNSSGVLTAGASCTLSVKFAPTTSGKRDAQIRLVDDGQASPQEIAITGIGT